MKTDNLFYIIKEKGPIALCLFLMGIVYLLVGMYSMGQHPYMGETDTGAFFGYAIAIKDHGGLGGTLGALFDGSFRLSNQHPLFPMIISTFFERSTDYFVEVKLLNLFLGLFFLYLFFFIVSRECNTVVGLIGACLLVANDTFMHQTTMVACETLLVIFTSLSFYFIIKGVDNNRHWALAGVFTGLAYMTKASGLFIVFGFGLFLLIDVRFRFWKLLKNKYLWFFLAGFVVVSLPLLVRNTIVHGFPFYNFNVEMLAWDESWSNADTATFSDIFKRDIGENLHRFFWGLARELRILVYSLYSFSIHYVPRFQFDTASMLEKIAAAVVAAGVFGSGITGFIVSSFERRKKLLVSLLLLGFYLPLSWYSITSPNRRYLLPVLPFFIVFAAYIIWRGAAQVHEKAIERFPGKFPAPVERSAVAAVVLILAVTVLVYPVARAIPLPSQTVRLEDGYEELAEYFRKQMGPGEKYLSKGAHHYPWLLLHPELTGKMSGARRLKDFTEFERYLLSRPDITHILMHQELYRATRNALKQYIALDRSKGLVVLKAIPGWKVVKQDPRGFVDYILFKKTVSVSPNP